MGASALALDRSCSMLVLTRAPRLSNILVMAQESYASNLSQPVLTCCESAFTAMAALSSFPRLSAPTSAKQRCLSVRRRTQFRHSQTRGRRGDSKTRYGIELKSFLLRLSDAAIDQYGMPFYCKIDVEGFEQSVLLGLTRQIPVLSFEFCAEGLDQTQTCLDLLSRLGYAAFNACVGDTRGYVLRSAVSSTRLMDHLRSMSDPLAWGDVYAAVGLRMPESRLLPR